MAIGNEMDVTGTEATLESIDGAVSASMSRKIDV